jgi:hypothetical protein
MELSRELVDGCAGVRGISFKAEETSLAQVGGL